MVTRTHRLKILRTVQLPRLAQADKRIHADRLMRCLAACLILDGLACFFSVFVDGFLNFASLVDFLRQRIEDRLGGRRRLRSMNSCDEHNRQCHCHTFNVTHVHLNVFGPGRSLSVQYTMFRFAFLVAFFQVVHAAMRPWISTPRRSSIGCRDPRAGAGLAGAMPAHIRQLFMGTPPRRCPIRSLPQWMPPPSADFASMYSSRPALGAFAANLDADTVKKTEAFLASDLGKRMVAADVALATATKPTAKR